MSIGATLTEDVACVYAQESVLHLLCILQTRIPIADCVRIWAGCREGRRVAVHPATAHGMEPVAAQQNGIFSSVEGHRAGRGPLALSHNGNACLTPSAFTLPPAKRPLLSPGSASWQLKMVNDIKRRRDWNKQVCCVHADV